MREVEREEEREEERGREREREGERGREKWKEGESETSSDPQRQPPCPWDFLIQESNLPDVIDVDWIPGNEDNSFSAPMKP